MKDWRPENPFSTAAYYGPAYFCDRQEEADQILRNITGGSSTTLMAIRRIGKTGLMHHVISRLPRGWTGIYADIQETENMNQFLNLLVAAILQSSSEKSTVGKKLWKFIASLRPLISFDPLTGLPQVTFDVKQPASENNIQQVFLFLEKQDFKSLIVIDEFQQIISYPEKNMDAWLRARVQQLKNVVFVFTGSQQHLMTELFTSPNRPFFRSTQIMKLGKLNPGIYRDFIMAMFQKYKKKISPEIASDILNWAGIHTYYVQHLCNRVFTATAKEVTAEIWKQQAHQVLKEEENVFFAFRNMLTRPQWNLLKAIAREGQVYQPTSKDFIRKFDLGSSATVLRSLKTLQDYELVYHDYTGDGIKYLSVYDVFFQRWTETR